MTFPEIMAALGLGFAAGILGGLAGIGGSVVMIPGLYLIFGSSPASVHHLYMASAMTVNVAVAFPSAARHLKAKAIRRDLLPVLAVSTTLAIIAGVLLSNSIDGRTLRTALGVFVAVYATWNILRAVLRTPDFSGRAPRYQTPRLVVSGTATGLVSGLLGLGGGILLVPLLQLLNRVPLRNAIATSAALMCLTAVVGAGLKLATLPSVGQEIGRALLYAALLAPTAIVGANLGARLTHSMPLGAVRVAIGLLLLVASYRLLAG